jgi:prepilin-type N-terminal cleavage/methylation domain-containing protein/prepilin-type processing-associated H-X9-DG protein
LVSVSALGKFVFVVFVSPYFFLEVAMIVRARIKRGFTLIELLVVIAIIAVLVSLLLPAVQQAREAARRTQCRNALKQLALGFHNYHEALGTFPPGWISKIGTPFPGPGQNGNIVTGETSLWAWGAMILPYVDQQPLYDVLNVGPTTLSQDLTLNLAICQTPLGLFRCPSDSAPDLNNYQDSQSSYPSTTASYNYRSDVPDTNGVNQLIATSNYVGVAGTSDSTTPAIDPNYYFSGGKATGLLFQNSKTKIRDIRDGSTNTLLLGERAWMVKNGLFGAGTVLGFSASNDVQSASAAGKIGALNAVAIGYDGINATINGNHDRRGFSSTHPGGAHFALADGSVRFISENIDYSKQSITNPQPPAYPGNCVTSTFARLLCYWDGQVVGDY